MIIPGFRFAATAAGIKKTGAPDLALLAAERTRGAAGVFTTNRCQGGPVLLSQERLRGGGAQAILVKRRERQRLHRPRRPGGRPGERLGVARLLKIPERLVLPASTGVIRPAAAAGEELPRRCPSWRPASTPRDFPRWPRHPDHRHPAQDLVTAREDRDGVEVTWRAWPRARA